MRSRPDALKLPSKLIDELGGQDFISSGRKGRSDITSRKERRKAQRSEKKSQHNALPPLKRQKIWHNVDRDLTAQEESVLPISKSQRSTTFKDGKVKPKSILKTTKQPDPSSMKLAISPEPSRSISKGFLDKLAEDDADIAALERKLGLKGKKREKGLEDELLEGLGGEIDDKDVTQEDERTKAEQWLTQKRRKAQSYRDLAYEKTNEDFDDEVEAAIDGELSSDDEDGVKGVNKHEDTPDENDEYDEYEGCSPGPKSEEMSDSPDPPKRVRENPYVAPVSQSDIPAAKYIPPSLRKPISTDYEVLTRLRRQAQGLVNRLTEANLISILGDVEKLYRDNARQHVSSTLIELLLSAVCEPTSLPDTLIILPAGFISAIYKIVGTDFGAQVIERIVELFDEHYTHATKFGNSGPGAATSDTSKVTSNLITLVSDLYNFQVVGSNLMFDYIRLFLNTLSELNAELLLKMIRTSGPQLRQDDPSSLKDIVNMLRPAAISVGEENISVRTKFMIETINDLKNNRMKTGAVASAVTSEHTIRMKKILGTLNNRDIKASEPLRIGLKDLQQADKKGKWWLVGASWAGNSETMANEVPNDIKRRDFTSEVVTIDDTGPSDLGELAREHRMNTDIRRAIFVTIMSASDYQDANIRLRKLKLKKAQELEIPKVLIHCAGAEKHYNPYYTLIAKTLCGDKKLKMSFQFCLWDLFKRLGESEDDNEIATEEEVLDARQLISVAKMFGALIVEGDLSLSVLKNLNLSYLQPRTKLFVEVLMVTVFVQSQKNAVDMRDKFAVARIISKAKEIPQLSIGLQYFFRKVLSKTDLAGGKLEKATVKWSCRVAADILLDIKSVDATEL